MVFFSKKMNAFGIDISDFSIDVLELRGKSGAPYVSAYGRIELKRGIVERGKIMDPQKLSEHIRLLVAQTTPKPVETPYCVFSLPEQLVFYTTLTFSSETEQDNFERAMLREAEKIVPFDIHDSYYDYIVSYEDSDEKRVFFAATPRKNVEEYLRVLVSAGLEPLVFDLEPLSIARVLIGENPGKRYVLVDIGAHFTNISIFNEAGMIVDGYSIDVGGSAFTEEIAKSLKVSTEKAEQLKRDEGLDRRQGKGRVMLILQHSLEPIVVKIKEILDYKGEKNRFEKIFLSGGSCMLRNIDVYLTENVGIGTEVGAPLIKIGLKHRDVLYHNVMGLALLGAGDGSGIHMNLLKTVDKKAVRPEKQPGEDDEISSPAEIYKPIELKKGRDKMLHIWIALLVISFLGLVWAFWFRNAQRQKAVGREENFNVEYEPVKEDILDIPVPVDNGITGEESAEYGTVTETETGYLNVREGAGLGFKRISRIYPGERYKILEREEKWYRIRLEDGSDGWVFRRYVDVERR